MVFLMDVHDDYTFSEVFDETKTGRVLGNVPVEWVRRIPSSVSVKGRTDLGF